MKDIKEIKEKIKHLKFQRQTMQRGVNFERNDSQMKGMIQVLEWVIEKPGSWII